MPVKVKGGRKRSWEELSDHEAALATVKGRRKEGEMGRKNHGLQHSYKKGLANLIGCP